MSKIIMVGCDLHDKSMLLKSDAGGKVLLKSWANKPEPRRAMIADLQSRAAAVGAERIVFAYEASGLGFGLWDELTAAGIVCHVLAPTGMASSRKHRQQKTDEKDAQKILEHLRGALLAGNELADVWVPDKQTRDDRELTRLRLDLGEKISVVKSQIRCLLKRNGVEAHEAPVKGWTSGYIAWLKGLCVSRLGAGATAALESLLRQVRGIEDEKAKLDTAIGKLSRTPRYEAAVKAMRRDKGVGILTAMVYLTEMGDLSRFKNRRQVAAFLGLTPTSHESGEAKDRKGHISHRGPGRVRKVLNQATWAGIRNNPAEKDRYDRLAAKNPNHKKVAVTAAMRRLGVRCWHNGLEGQTAARAQAASTAAPAEAARTAVATTVSKDVCAPVEATGASAPATASRRRENFREFFQAGASSSGVVVGPPNKVAANDAADDPHKPRRRQVVPPAARDLHWEGKTKQTQKR